MEIEKLLQRLEKVKKMNGGWKACCPAHDDQNPSLSISLDREGKILIHCHAGCDYSTVLNAMGFETSDLSTPLNTVNFSSKNGRSRAPKAQIIKTYDYNDVDGNLQYQVCRLAPKQFRQRRPDGTGNWIWNVNGVKRILYNLKEVKEQARSGKCVFIVEGEKDADALAAATGNIVTTCSGGAEKWDDRFAEDLAGAVVVIIPDNDEPGRRHAHQIARSLVGKVISTRIVYLPGLPNKGDVSDWLAGGGNQEQLNDLINATPFWQPDDPQLLPAISAAKLEVISLADVTSEQVRWLWPGRIPFGKISLVDGDPGTGKTTMVIDIAARLSRADAMPGEGCSTSPCIKGNSLLICMEDGPADTLKPRAESAGADLRRIFIVNGVPDENGNERPLSLPEDIGYIQEIIERHEIHLVVIDPLMAILSAGVNSYKDQDVRRALTPLARMAETTGAAIVVLRHLNKGQGISALYRGGGSIGIVGAARSALLVAVDPQDPQRRILASIKGNLAPKPPSLGFRLTAKEQGGTAHCEWLGEVDHSADTVLAIDKGESRSPQIAEATTFLEDLLADGPVAASTVFLDAKGAGISESTLNRAKYVLGIKPRRTNGLGAAGHWEWSLPAKKIN